MVRTILDSCESVYNFKNSDEVIPFQVSGCSRNGNTIGGAVEASENKTQSELNLYEFLERTEAYNHNPERVEHIQTHISHVFIAPPFVYKIKKPVDFGFLDYSTLSKRKHFCEREVELNRRLCSNIYLGVVPVSKKEGGFQIEPDSKAEAIEYAVKMRKLDDRFFLQFYIEKGILSTGHLDRVAKKLSDFYERQRPGSEVIEYGEIEKIRYNTDENFRQTKEFIGETIDRESFEAIRYFTNHYLDRKEALFQRRIAEKRIVDGHGDLHLDHIHLMPERMCIYDCIEFNERFRYGDLAVDLAFLAMDLDFNDQWKLERYFMGQMAEKLDDPDLLNIIDFYKCYRAYVKGKVKSMQSAEEEVSEKGREEAREKAENYFNLSLRYALLGSHPIVLIFMGRVATGKSTLAEHFHNIFDIDCYSSDRIRKTMAGLPLDERTPSSRRKELYSPDMSKKTYSKLFEEAISHVQQGRSVILDATFSSRAARKELTDKLDNTGTDYMFIETRSMDKTIISRLKSREGEEGIISDARRENFKQLDASYEPPEKIDDINLIQVETDTTLRETLETLYRKLSDRQIL